MLVNLVTGLATGIIGSFVVFAIWPWVRRHWIHSRIQVKAEPYTQNVGLWCRVVNGSPFTMGKAVAYVTIEHQVSDVTNPNPLLLGAYINPADKVTLREGQLCWGVQEPGNKNPMRIDIYSLEEQPLTLGYVSEDCLAILSEQARSPVRVYLKRQRYKGALKVVCMDCHAKVFAFTIDPDHPTPLSFDV